MASGGEGWSSLSLDEIRLTFTRFGVGFKAREDYCSVDMLQVVAEPHRREILRLVWDRKRSAGDIARHFEVSFPAVSQHLGILRAAGFVSVSREGKRRYYQADLARLGTLNEVLEGMWSQQEGRLALLAEQAQEEGGHLSDDATR